MSPRDPNKTNITIDLVADILEIPRDEVAMLLLIIDGFEREDHDSWVSVEELAQVFTDKSRREIRYMCEECHKQELLDKSSYLGDCYGTSVLTVNTLPLLFPTYEELAAA